MIKRKSFIREVYEELLRMFGLNIQKLLKLADFIIFTIIVIFLIFLMNLIIPQDIKRVYYLLITYFLIGLSRTFYEKYKKNLVKKCQQKWIK